MPSLLRHPIRLMAIAAGVLAIGASNTECDSEAVKPLLMSLREIHAALDEVEEAVCDHYTLSGHAQERPAFCPDIDPCDEPVKIGPCRAAIPRWYFDGEAGECRSFSWGGCEPGANNFLTKEECEGVCDPCEAECGPSQVCVRDGACRGGPCDHCADTCDGAECAPGEQCELVTVTCVTLPCPPVAQCVPERIDPCDDHLCDPGFRCEAMRGLDQLCLEIDGLACPPPPPMCVPEDDPCDDFACGDDEKCVHEIFDCEEFSTSCEAFGAASCVLSDPCDAIGGCGDGQDCLTYVSDAQFDFDHFEFEAVCQTRWPVVESGL